MPPLPPDVDLHASLLGGQCFTWWPQQGCLEGITRGTRLSLDPEAGVWTSQPECPAAFMATYLGAERVQPAALADDEHLGDLARALPGLRLLDQDPWEGLLAFMISPVNNVPRIQETIARLCRALGPPVADGRGLPGPAAVAEASEAQLRELGLGFRAPRVLAVAEAVESGELELDRLRKAPLGEARDRLLAYPGIGPKVAECILCYALGRDGAFPVDRWVQRAGERLLGACPSPSQARERWGQRAAMAQQLLFHGGRMGLVEGLEASPVAGFRAWRPLQLDRATR